MTIIATRIYPLDDFEARDIMNRNQDGSFTMTHTTNGHPGEPDSVASYSLSEVHEWLRDMPSQITRAVY